LEIVDYKFSIININLFSKETEGKKCGETFSNVGLFLSLIILKKDLLPKLIR